MTSRSDGRADCPNIEANLQACNCSYVSCERKGMCCQCVAYHRRMKQLPACFFTEAAEKTYDRSFDRFIKTWT
jgi:hypothetical protein